MEKPSLNSTCCHSYYNRYLIHMLGFEMVGLRINLFIRTLKILGPNDQSIFVIFDKYLRVKIENISLSTKLCLNISLSFSMSHVDCLSENYIFYINIFSQFYKDNPQFVFRLLLKVYGSFPSNYGH